MCIRVSCHPPQKHHSYRVLARKKINSAFKIQPGVQGSCELFNGFSGEARGEVFGKFTIVSLKLV